MRRVICSMGTSLDGYIVDADGEFAWSKPDEELFAFVTEEIRHVDAFVLGRRLYQTMLYWENVDQLPGLSEAELVWARLWQALPKVVFSTTLTSVRGNTRLARRGLAEEIERLRAEPGDGDIAVGGAHLAAQAAELGVIDEYRIRVHPVLVGGGVPFFPRNERHVDLELKESRVFGSGVVYQRYRVTRQGPAARKPRDAGREA
jgi:dihydrofolate reductase